MSLTTDQVRVDFDGRVAVDGVSLTVATGDFVALVGPNGSGKSTLLRSIYRAQRPRGGTITVEGTDVWTQPAAWVAQHIGVHAQDHYGGFDLTAYEAVSLGRSPHHGWIDRLTAADHQIVTDCLQEVGCTHLAARSLATMSGGERQRVLLARALAQQPQVLLLDEPTNHLDPRHRIEVLDLVRSVGRTVLAALHDLDLAASTAEQLLVLYAGRLVAAGPPLDVLTPDLLADVFGVAGTVLPDPVTGTPRVLLRALHPARRDTSPRTGV